MSANSDFYLARADDCAREATEAKLDNVRDRCLRSEAVWRLLAERLIRSETFRERMVVEKAMGVAPLD